MATDIQTTTEPRTRLYRLNVDQYLRMINAGIFTYARVELLDGLLVHTMTRNPPHDFTISRLGKLIQALLSTDWTTREGKSVVLGRYWRPSPTLPSCEGRTTATAAVPTITDIALLIEVSDSTYARDRGLKWRGYATARVPMYVIVNLQARTVEVYTQPSGKGKTAAYGESHVYGSEDVLPLVLAGQPAGTIAVKDILP